MSGVKPARQIALEAEGWVFKFEAAKGERLMKRFFGVTTFGTGASLWWDRAEGNWVHYGKGHGREIGSHHYIRSFKAFLRHLQRYQILADADEVVLESRFVGCSVIAYPPRPALSQGGGE